MFRFTALNTFYGQQSIKKKHSGSQYNYGLCPYYCFYHILLILGNNQIFTLLFIARVALREILGVTLPMREKFIFITHNPMRANDTPDTEKDEDTED